MIYQKYQMIFYVLVLPYQLCKSSLEILLNEVLRYSQFLGILFFLRKNTISIENITLRRERCGSYQMHR